MTDAFIKQSPEAALLLLAARPHVSSVTVEKIRSVLGQRIEWDRLIRTAHHHGVASLTHRGLVAARVESIPAAALQALLLACHTTEMQNRYLADQLLRVLKLLDVAGLRAIPVKGPVLSYSVYGSLALRSTRDLDLFVRQRDVIPVKEILLEDDFQLLKPTGFSSTRGADFDRYHEFTFGKPEEGVYVETQWAAGNSRFHSCLKVDAYWDRLTTVLFEGVEVKGLRREDLLVLLCEHGTKHFWNRLKWTCDIAELVNGEDGMDWGEVFERARTVGAERAVLVGLALSRDLLGCDLPDAVEARVRADPSVAPLTAQVGRRLFSRRGDDFGVFSWQKCLFHARSRERARDQAGHAARFLQFLASPIGKGPPHYRQEPLSDYLLLPARVIRRAGRHFRAKERSWPKRVEEIGHQL